MDAIADEIGKPNGNCSEDPGLATGEAACVVEDVARIGGDSFSSPALPVSSTGSGTARAAPHWLQNRLILGLVPLQTWHSTAFNNPPQPPQNNAFGRFLKPQEWQPSISEKRLAAIEEADHAMSRRYRSCREQMWAAPCFRRAKPQLRPANALLPKTPCGL